MRFFDRISSGIKRATGSLKRKTSDITECARLKARINEEEAKLNTLFKDLGKLVYKKSVEAGTNTEHDLIPPVVEEITTTIENITYYKKTIITIKGITMCVNCGAEVPENMLFCGMCGSAVVREKPPETMEETGLEDLIYDSNDLNESVMNDNKEAKENDFEEEK